MADPAIIEFLIERARKSSDQCARTLAQALRRETSDRQQLELLMRYRLDYAARYARMCRDGTTLAAMRNFEAFLARLDQAISQQRQAVEHATASATSARGALGEAERKRQSMTILRDRRTQSDLHAALRREQAQSDEFASRSARTAAEAAPSTSSTSARQATAPTAPPFTARGRS